MKIPSLLQIRVTALVMMKILIVKMGMAKNDDDGGRNLGDDDEDYMRYQERRSSTF